MPCLRLVTGTRSIKFTIVFVIQVYNQEKTHVVVTRWEMGQPLGERGAFRVGGKDLGSYIHSLDSK